MPEVLLVDEREGTRLLLAMAFADAGYEVREAADGIEALAELVQEAPDVMVLDLALPHLGGIAVLTAMRERGLAATTRVLVHTAEDTDRRRACVEALGVDGLILKPTDPFSVVDRVEAVLSLAGAPRLARDATSAETRPPAEVFSLAGRDVPGGGDGLAEVIELSAYVAGAAS